MNLSSDIYQFDVHLREGYIVPLQNATRHKVNKTKDLQNNAVDLHIHPTCNADKSECSATGTLLNDDGIVLNYKDAQNRYAFSFSLKQASLTPTAISLDIAVTA